MAAKLLSLLLALMALGGGTLERYADEMSLGGNLFLVNRTYPVARDYVPRDLTAPKVQGGGEATMMRREAAEALEALFAAARDEAGYTLIAVSGYRSYGRQAAIHERKVKAVGKKAALRVSAPPGCSEHQLGLAMDLGCKGHTELTAAFGKTPEGAWVRDNCCRFGFIIRYQAEWEPVTGYADEPWHIRYVGREHAQRIHEMEIPLEYYIAQLREAQLAYLSEKE